MLEKGYINNQINNNSYIIPYNNSNLQNLCNIQNIEKSLNSLFEFNILHCNNYYKLNKIMLLNYIKELKNYVLLIKDNNDILFTIKFKGISNEMINNYYKNLFYFVDEIEIIYSNIEFNYSKNIIKGIPNKLLIQNAILNFDYDINNNILFTIENCFQLTLNNYLFINYDKKSNENIKKENISINNWCTFDIMKCKNININNNSINNNIITLTKRGYDLIYYKL